MTQRPDFDALRAQLANMGGPKGPKPLARQRSEWVHVGAMTIEGIEEMVWSRNVNDGQLKAIVGLEPEGWHLSISFTDHRGHQGRYPSWDEIAHARYELLPLDATFVMFLPPPSEYVAVHDTTFHLHQLVEQP